MTDYRAVVRHVRYWRGAVHRWSTSYEYTGSGTTPDAVACQNLLHADDNLCYCETGVNTGGTYECEIYLASGGSPIATYTAFNWEVPADWIPHSASGWAAKTATAQEVAEVAMLIEWGGGLSSSGKPVKFRKWYHAVQLSAAGSTPGSPDIATANLSTLQTAANTLQSVLNPTYGLLMGNARRLAAASPTISPYYSNHQMPRGRRRKALVSASGKYNGPRVSVPPIEED